MALPAQVRTQSESANKLIEELGAQLAGGNPPTPPDASGNPPTPAPAAPSNPPEQRQDDQLELERQRYRTLQGMYNADTAALRQRVKDLENLIASVPAPKPDQPKVDAQKLITDKDVEEYGESIEVMRRAAREEASAIYAPVIQELRQKVEQLQGVVPKVHNLEQSQTVNAEQRFWSDLTAKVPDWRDINTNPVFQEWLFETDALSGLTRQTFLEDAQRNLDVARVVSFFTSWPGAKSATPPAHVVAQQSELDKQVAPGRARTASPAPTNDTKVYTREEITKFYRDVSSGVYKGQDAERSRIERDIFAAQREGRIAS